MKQKLLHVRNIPLKTRIIFKNSQYFLDIWRQNSRLDEILLKWFPCSWVYIPPKIMPHLHSGTFPF